MTHKIIIRGGGDLASGIARLLYLEDFWVVILEKQHPRAVRRAVAFASAIYENEVEIEDVRGVLCDKVPDGPTPYIPVVIDETGHHIAQWQPDVLIDARMMRKVPSDTHPGQAHLVIGLGPGFRAPEHCHVVIETNRGPALGQAIYQGMAEANTGIPSPVAGYRQERVLRAPQAGIFDPKCNIGDTVVAGAEIGAVDRAIVYAQIAGVVRGLLYPHTPVVAGQKLGDIDPRGEVQTCFQISDKAQAVARGVLEAISFFLGAVKK